MFEFHIPQFSYAIVEGQPRQFNRSPGELRRGEWGLAETWPDTAQRLITSDASQMYAGRPLIY